MTRSELLLKALEKANDEERIKIMRDMYYLGFVSCEDTFYSDGLQDMEYHMNNCFNREISDKSVIDLSWQKIANK